MPHPFPALRRSLLTGVLVAMSYTSLTACSSPSYPETSHYRDGRFFNAKVTPEKSLGERLGIFWRLLFDRPVGTVPSQPIPVQTLTREALLAAPEDSLFRLGHSTLLLKLSSGFWLTDPVFSERASPFQWIGPKRFHPSPIALDQLPPLTGVILSHDHYDHLDQDTVQQLADQVQYFVAPVGVGDRLIEWGVPAAKVRQLDWWQSTEAGGLKLVATPAQHFSGRGLHDRNRTLWTSWVIQSGSLKLFFSGDTGYFDGFRQIGERYGPFDLTMLETGAYNSQWPDVHMQPEETLQAHLDLKGRWLLPIHNGTFDLAMHPWQEPFERIATLADRQQVALTTPQMGQRLDLRRPESMTRWWR
ncbi:MBL fold metallo-hydrolase [Chitinimonas lacunae]|uniref:MBL fold metallo-hydrolase n=1 Tax=Chitinimonas lacunae TaxID=1963018 RepID=A0ABV8MQD6_9NEIS